MAYDFFANKDDEEKQGGASSGAEPLSSQSPVITGNTPQAAGEGKPTSSGQFTNLQSYLDANKSIQFGQGFANRIEDKVDEAKAAQESAKQGFENEADKNSVQTDTGLLESTRSDPTKVASNDESYQGFKKMYDASYRGPKNLTDTEYYAPAYQATTSAYDTANQTKNEAGRKAVLQKEYGTGAGRNDYTSGLQKLDNLLIQNDPHSRGALSSVQGKAQAAQGEFANLQRYLSQYAGQKAQETQSARDKSHALLGVDSSGNQVDGGDPGLIQNTLSDLDSRAAAAKAGKDASFLSTQAQLKNRQVPADIGSVSGLHSYNIDPSQYLSPGTDPNRSSIASVADRAKLDALAKLSARPQAWIDAAAPYYDPNKAYNFDSAGFNTQQKASEADYNDTLSNLRFLGDVGGGNSMNILSSGASDADKLSQLKAISQGNGQSITELLNQFSSSPLYKAPYADSAALNRLTTAQKIVDLVNRVKGYGNTLS